MTTTDGWEAPDEPDWLAEERAADTDHDRSWWDHQALEFGPDPDRDLPEAEITSRFIDGASFVLDGPAEYTPLWGKGDEIIWPEGETCLLCGPQGLAKSTLMQQVALRRAGILDGTVLGWPIEPDPPVLYLAMDRPMQIKRSLRRMVGEAQRDLLEERLIVWKGPPPADLARRPEMLTQMVAESGATSVFIDSLKDAAVGLADDEVGAGLNRALQMALSHGYDVMGAHHQRKAQQGASKPRTLDDVYGSVWITSGAGSVILLWGKAGDIVIDLEHLKPPAEPIGPLKIQVDFTTGAIDAVDEVNLVQLAARAHNGLTVDGAARALFLVTDPDRNQIEKARRRLEAHPGLERSKSETGVNGKEAVTYRAIERYRDDEF